MVSNSFYNFSEGINWIETEIEAVIWKTLFSTIAFSQKQQIHIQSSSTPEARIQTIFHVPHRCVQFRLIQGHFVFDLTKKVLMAWVEFSQVKSLNFFSWFEIAIKNFPIESFMT